MTAALVRRLLAAIQHAESDDVRAYRTAELACYWARVGEFKSAQKLHLQLRESHGKGENPKVSILIILLEGLLNFYMNLDSKGRDRLERAAFLSKFFGFRDLVAITYSSLAHIDFNACRYEDFSTDIEECLSSLRRENFDAECRVSLVLGDAFLYCQRPTESQAWYERTRVAYTKLGDQAAIGAITYNRAALRAINMRLAAQESTVEESEIHAIGTEIKSSMSYQSIAKLRSLDRLPIVALIGVDVCMKNYPSALESSTEILARNSIPRHSGEHLIVLSDQALCLARLGNLQAAKESLQSIQKIDTADFDADDRSIIFWNFAETANELNQRLVEKKYRDLSRSSLMEHKGTISKFYLMIKSHKANSTSKTSVSS